MNKMRAVIKTEKGVGLIELREVHIPEPKEGELLRLVFLEKSL